MTKRLLAAAVLTALIAIAVTGCHFHISVHAAPGAAPGVVPHRTADPSASHGCAPFALHLTPGTIRAAARTLSTEHDLEAELR
jgi:hypothetical protein